MFSAWNAKIATSVASSARIVTGWNAGSSRLSNHSAPFARRNQARDSEPIASGITTKTSTDISSTEKGTTSPAAPATSRLTIGAKANSMTRSLIETWTSV